MPDAVVIERLRFVADAVRGSDPTGAAVFVAAADVLAAGGTSPLVDAVTALAAELWNETATVCGLVSWA